LQILHPVFDVRLLVASGRHAAERLEIVVAGQGQVTPVELPLAALQDRHCHRRRVVPPDLSRHAAEEGERLCYAVQDRFRPLGGQRNGKRAVRVRPGNQQHRNLTATLREIHPDMAEVTLRSLTRDMLQRDERLPPLPAPAGHIPADLVVAPGEAVLGDQPPEDLGCCVPLLRRRRLVRLQDPVDDRLDRV
jgi:hypothetical protein